jgi:hypothetical protein
MLVGFEQGARVMRILEVTGVCNGTHRILPPEDCSLKRSGGAQTVRIGKYESEGPVHDQSIETA